MTSTDAHAEPGALISNKTSIIAGVRIGHNAIVGANVVVSHSIAPDSVAAGIPAVSRRHFDGAPVPTIEDRRILAFGWFGTSIMEHLKGHNAQLVDQANLPEIGSQVTVETWRRRGYVQRLYLGLQAVWPHISFYVDNRGEGGATSRDIAAIVAQAADGSSYDLAFLGCGINDVWDGFHGRTAEAVDAGEFAEHYATTLHVLTGCSRQVICIAETPFGPIDAPETVAAMNTELARYNKLAAAVALHAGALFLDVWGPFTAAARQLATAPPDHSVQTLWSDGVHLSELGDALMLHQVEAFLAERRIVQSLIDYPRLERSLALELYDPRA